MKLIILGPPGAGKGTQSQLISSKCSIPQLSTGDMLRAAVNAGTPVGLKVKENMAAAGLVPDAIVVGIIADRIAEPDCARGFILDGFPRTLPQAAALDQLLKSKGQKLDSVIELRVEEVILASRIEKRASETLAAGGNVRADDNIDALKVRLMAYYRETAPLTGYYFAHGLLKTVDGMAPIAEVTRHIDQILAPFGVGRGDVRIDGDI